MSQYIFKGRLCGYICPECPEPLSNVIVRLYKITKDVTARAVASPKETFSILQDDAAQAKKGDLIAETRTDAEGNYTFNLGEKTGYKGEAFEVDIYCETVPGRKPGKKPPRPLQFSVTTLQPAWRQTDAGFVAVWDYCIPARFWCGVRARFDAWVICGQVSVCKADTSVGGVRVKAFDADWIQDDALGSAVTDASGRFRIDYLTEDFQKTPFSPFINFEWIGGPDIYFSVESLAGTTLLAEARARARDPDRENAGHCFCVQLCLAEQPPTPEPLSVFTHVGGYHFLTTIDSAPAGTGLTIGGNRAFYSTNRLNGILAKTLNGNPVEYMFEYAQYDPVTNVLGAWTQVAQTQIARTVIGIWEHYDPVGPLDPNPIKTKEYTVNGTAGPNEMVASFTPDGWVQVPQENNVFGPSGFFQPNGNMIALISNTLAAFGSVNLAGLAAGASSTSTGMALAQDRHFALRMWVREAGGANVLGGTCERIAIDNTLYDNLVHHPSWGAWSQSGALAVAMLDIAQLQADGCAGISNQLDVLYTAAHPNLGAVSIWMTGPGGPYGFTLAGPVTPDTFGTATPGFVVADLVPCAYIVHLSVQVLLTTGDSVPDLLYDEIAFCK